MQDEAPGYVDPDDEVPDAIADFLKESGIGKKFVCYLIEHRDGEAPGTLREYTNEYPSMSMVGKEWGPGKYTWRFSFRVTGMSGKKEMTIKELTHNLPERAWSEKHKEYRWEQEQKSIRDEEDRMARAVRESKMSSIRSGNSSGSKEPSDPMQLLKSALQTARELGIPVGGRSVGSAPDKDPFGTMIPLIAALSPIFLEIIKGKNSGGGNDNMMQFLMAQDQRRKDNMQMLLGAAGTLLPIFFPKGFQTQDKYQAQLMEMTMNAVRQVSEFKMALNPPEPSMLDRIFEKAGPFIPMILEFAQKTREERDRSLTFKMASQSELVKDIKSAAQNPSQLNEMVGRLDREYGVAGANQILDVLGIQVPANIVRESPAGATGEPDAEDAEESESDN